MSDTARGFGQRGKGIAPVTNAVGPNGRPLCRWCMTEVAGRRKSWCSDECVHQYLIRQWDQVRKVALRRDRACRLCGLVAETPGVRWEVDHIIPVADGGTDHPDNLRRVCQPCHAEITTSWRRERVGRLANDDGVGQQNREG